MRYIKYVLVLGVFAFMLIPGAAHAQVAVQFGAGYVGPAPVCAYGYYGFYPYSCAPYGYYGPDDFANGVFIGAGPWFHGGFHDRGFYDRDHYNRGFYDRGPVVNHGDGRFSGGFRGDVESRLPATHSFSGGGSRGGSFHGGGRR